MTMATSPAEPLIERAAARDRDALVRLLGVQLADHDIVLDDVRLGGAIDGVLADASRGIFVVARLAARVVGVAYLSFTWCLEHGGRSAWLEELYVEPDHRLRGIGRALLVHACSLAKASGCAAVDLEVDATHARAANLYLRLGFHPHQRARWVRVLH